MVRFVFSAPGAIGYVNNRRTRTPSVKTAAHRLACCRTMPVSAPPALRGRAKAIGDACGESSLSRARPHFALLAAATLTVLRSAGSSPGTSVDRLTPPVSSTSAFGEGLDIIDDILFETGEVRRILLYALHTTDANRQLDYVDQSRSAEGRVRSCSDSRSPILSTTRNPRRARVGRGRVDRLPADAATKSSA
jgi:hypothetical protein